jgi:hypothetical protein
MAEDFTLDDFRRQLDQVPKGFGGNPKWRMWDYIFGPEDPPE